MAIDIEEGYESIGSSITKNKTYKQISLDYKKLKKKAVYCSHKKGCE